METDKGLSAAEPVANRDALDACGDERKLRHWSRQRQSGPRAGALPERGGGDVVHQLGERQGVGGGPAAAAHGLQRQTRQVRAADLAGFSAVQEQLSSQREGGGHLEVKYTVHSSTRLRPCPGSKTPPRNSFLQNNAARSKGKPCFASFKLHHSND